jgi:hypothetical protein
MNRDTLEKIRVSQGSVILIQRHCAPKSVPSGLRFSSDDDVSDDDEDEKMTVGIAYPMSQIQPDGIVGLGIHGC